jgi:hypothetical protein
MTFRVLLLFSGLLVPIATSSARERVEEKSFLTSGIAELNVKSYGGNLTIEDSPDDIMRVKVVATSQLSDDQAADRALQTLEFTSHQEGDRVTLEVANPPETSPHFSWDDKAHLELAITVTVPRTCRLNLVTGKGEIRIGEIRGDVQARVGQGAILCRYVDGSVSAYAVSGDILVSHCTGDVDLRTDRGGIRTGRIEGRATLSATSGDIDIMSAARGLKVSVDGGDLTAGIPRQFSGDSSLLASGGNITLKIDPAARLDLDASAVWGRVRSLTKRPLGFSLVPVSGGLGQKTLIGKINSGGARLQVHASGGHVNLAAEASPFG